MSCVRPLVVIILAAILFVLLTDVANATPFYWNVGSRLVHPHHQRSSQPSPLETKGAAKEELSRKLREQNNVYAMDSGTFPRGGAEDGGGGKLDKTVSAVLKVFTSCCRTILPPVVAGTRAIVAFYSSLPMDAILAQAGLVYCFAGGYFPTLFSAVQAAQQCGWQTAVHAINDLAEEAVIAIRACDFEPSGLFWKEAKKRREIFTEKTKVVLTSIDPLKINQAVAALYTTWMGVSAVLEREYASTIALSISIGDYIRPITNFALAPIVYRCTPEEWHAWVPVVLGWGCKAAGMAVAWRIQRVLTAYSSAIAGGLMFSRATFRGLRKRGFRCFGLIPKDCEKSSIDEIFGFVVAAFGLYSQIGNGFGFSIPFPLNLVTWPFGIAERVLQWQITKDVD